MRLLINDFAGHPFQVQLSRELASRGHVVQHTFSDGLHGPKGALGKMASDSGQLTIRGISVGKFNKYSVLERFLCHRRYAAALIQNIEATRPEIVLSANTPIDMQLRLQRYCADRGIRFVHWMQDVYCIALESFLRRKAGALSAPLAWPYFLMEKAVCRSADAVISITDDFYKLLCSRGVWFRRHCTIENWAPLNELPIGLRDNAWRRSHTNLQSPLFLYSGTMGLKHKPELILALARRLADSGLASVMLVTEGIGRQYIERQLQRQTCSGLTMLNYQPYQSLPDVLSAADVLVATIDADSSRFAVPSKVLTYLGIGRPVLLAAPGDNLAARVVREAKAGLVVDPEDTQGFLDCALLLAADEQLRARLSANAREYACRTFDIGRITDRFEKVFDEIALPLNSHSKVFSAV
jgi:glycosyltransferase involved in cell wall biosynthesis